LAAARVTTRRTYRAFANRVKMFLTRDVEWRNRIVSAFREAGLPEGEEQWGLLAMSAFGHKCEVPTVFSNVRFQRVTQKTFAHTEFFSG
jgi:hypothetical protein